MSAEGGGLAPVAVAALVDGAERIVITGASGWLGSATIRLLYSALGDAMFARLHCFGSNARTLDLGASLTVRQQPLKDLADLPARPTLLLHFAYLTKERVEGMDADAYRAANTALSGLVLEALDKIGVTAVFLASSGAACSADDPAADPAMQLYGTMKKQDEADFAAWAAARGATAVIARIFNLAGPYINKHQNYALAAFIVDALAGRTITVHAPHRVIRGFVAIRELMSLVFVLMTGPAEVFRFDTGGDAAELGQVARLVADTLGTGPTVRAAITSERVDRYVGDREEYDRLRGLLGIADVSFAEQVRETADYLATIIPHRVAT